MNIKESRNTENAVNVLSSLQYSSEEISGQKTLSITADDEQFISTQLPSPVPLTEILSNSTGAFPLMNTINLEDPFPVVPWEEMDTTGVLGEEDKGKNNLDHEDIEEVTKNTVASKTSHAIGEKLYESPKHNMKEVSTSLHFQGETSDFVITPKPEDVISARGCGRSHVGNVRFRNLITKNKHAYDSNSSEEFRRSLALEVANKIKPGRFLKKEETHQEVYKVMPFEKMITKITFAMRDCKSHISSGRRKVLETTSTKKNMALKQKRKAAATTKGE